MNTLLTSALAERLGWTLLHSLWQIALIALALLMSQQVFRSPNARYILGMIALAASILWPVASFVQHAPPSPAVVRAAFEPGDLVPLPGEERDSRAPSSSGRSIKFERNLSQSLLSTPSALTGNLSGVLPWMAMLWLTGVCLLTLRQVGAFWSLHRLRTRGVIAVSASVRALFDQTKSRLGIRRMVSLAASARVMVPMVIGSLRPVVLMPASLLSGLPADQVEALLAHELAHLRRWDDVANLLQCVIETLLFYHPAVWWISRRVRDERELCCDDLATARGIGRSSLAQALAKLALWQSEARQPALAATGHMSVLARIQRLLQPSVARASINGWPVAMVLTAALLFAIVGHADAATAYRGRILDRKGVVLAECSEDGARHYPHKSLAAHVLGYTGTRSAEDPRPFGRSGIEQTMDRDLAANRDVQLTLDFKAQQFVEAMLGRQARRGGSAVVLDVTNGDLLVAASNPTFDPNEFAARIAKERFDELAKDDAHPLFPRAFEGAYYPASIFKLVTALAALKSGAIDEHTEFEGAAAFDIDGRTFHNWHTANEGPMILQKAIVRSCNTWFYQAALKTGAKPIIDMGAELGFGSPVDLPLKNGNGNLPSEEEYSKKFGKPMPSGLIAQIAIGQVATATPLQAAVATAAIANGGKVLRPRLVRTDAPPLCVRDLVANGLSPEHLELVKKGMIGVVNDDGGTGRNAQVSGVTVAGKTGTAQRQAFQDASKNTWLAWFVGFAPAERPKVAVVIVYEGAPGEHLSGGGICAPMAAEMIGQLRDQKMFEDIKP